MLDGCCSVSGGSSTSSCCGESCGCSTDEGTPIGFYSHYSSLQSLFSEKRECYAAEIEEFRKQYSWVTEVFVLFSLFTAKTMEVTTLNMAEAINMQHQRQRDQFKAMTNLRDQMQTLNEELAVKSWESLAGISPSGTPTVDPGMSQNERCWAIVAFFIMMVLFPLLIGPLIIISSIMCIVNMIIDTAIDDPAKKHQISKVTKWFDAAEIFSNGIVAMACEWGGKTENDPEMQKLKMWSKIAFMLLLALIMVVMSIILLCSPAAPAALILIAAIAALVMAAVQIVAGIMEIKRGVEALELAKLRYNVNRMAAVVEQIKMEVEAISIEIDALVEVFTSNVDRVREEYERAARMLKEYNDTKRAVARNIKA
ncbi:MAG: hypothetical protein LBT64_00155 [Puniceicoccales bacterium]|jgi:hypothetical protein|nr:hypothetical protein [Puniceicoccales bacterium]